MQGSGRRLLQGGNVDLRKKADIAFDKLLQDMLKTAQATQRNLILKEVAQLIAGVPDIALQADSVEQLDRNHDQG